MEAEVLQHMRTMVAERVKDSQLYELLLQSIEEKIRENSMWSDLTKASHRLFGGRSADIDRAAADTELLLLALDILDDLQDLDNFDKPWMRVKPETAMNAYLVLLMAATGDLAKLEARSGAGSVVADASALIVQAAMGQQADLYGFVKTEDDYVRMVYDKSGSLVRLALLIGYRLARPLTSEEEEKAAELGLLIGFMAQLRNDMRDVLRWDEKNDLLHRRRTLPSLYLLSYSRQDFPVLLQYYNGEIERDDFLQQKRKCLDFIGESGCLEYARAVLLLHLERAEQVLDGLETCEEAKRAFIDVALAPFR